MLSVGALWLLWRWWQDRWGGHAVLAAAFLVHPVLLLAAMSDGLSVEAFRQMTPLPILIIYLFVLTLILQQDARQLARELQQRRRAEAELQRLANDLDRQVHERTARLDELNQGLQAFSGMVSHDLRGPLRNIHGLSELVRESIEAGRAAEALPLVQKLGHESMRATHMVSDLLNLARVEGKALQKQGVDCNALVRGCLGQLALEYPDAPRCVQIGPLPVVQADAGLLAHVVMNLVGNALKYGQGRPGLAVTVTAMRDADAWRFSVADNGPGFSEARAGELFKPFGRLVADGIPGTGLGLTVVHRVVQQHGGAVGAQGRPGEGATFWWTLPA
jgi:signal transduction histidine kinase